MGTLKGTHDDPGGELDASELAKGLLKLGIQAPKWAKLGFRLRTAGCSLMGLKLHKLRIWVGWGAV